jgi:hypothetical protein
VALLLLADHHASQLLHVAQVGGMGAHHSLPAGVVIRQQYLLWRWLSLLRQPWLPLLILLLLL